MNSTVTAVAVATMSNEDYTTVFSCSHTKGQGTGRREVNYPCTECEIQKIKQKLSQFSETFGQDRPSIPSSSTPASFADFPAKMKGLQAQLDKLKRELAADAVVQQATGLSQQTLGADTTSDVREPAASSRLDRHTARMRMQRMLAAYQDAEEGGRGEEQENRQEQQNNPQQQQNDQLAPPRLSDSIPTIQARLRLRYPHESEDQINVRAWRVAQSYERLDELRKRQEE